MSSADQGDVALTDGQGIYLAIGVAVIVSTIITLYTRRKRCFEVPARDISKGHGWFYPDNLETAVYCNVCEMLVNGAGQCDSCSIYADRSCMKLADKKFPCKPLAWLGPITKHHWIKGNLQPGSICAQCRRECGADEGLCDIRCCWCQKTVHEACEKDIGTVCDLGRYRDCIIPPNCVRLKLVGWKGRRRFVVGEVKMPSDHPAEWSPVIVIANRKSGNNDGQIVLQSFRAVLNPVQVIDLNDLPLESALEWSHLVSSCRILVGGGDGTVGWVLNAIDRLKITPSPRVAILPLGTGNDLSRVLGWGEGISGDVNVHDILERISHATDIHLDRWKIRITPISHMRIRLPAKTVYVNNYASVGVDALVTLKFHQTRESKIYFYGSRLLNKFLFMSFATKDVWERECKNLREKVTVYLDGIKMALPDVEAVVVLNIPCWGAGVQPWRLGSSANSAPVQKIDDGLAEVFGVYSAFHIAQLQVGLSEPIRIGQAREIKLVLTDKVPMQVDGEPWEQGPSEILINRHSQATMLICRDKQLLY